MGWLTLLHEPEKDYGIWSTVRMLTHKASKGLLLVSIFSRQWRNGLKFYCLHYHRIKVMLLAGHRWPVNQSTNSGLAAFLSVFVSGIWLGSCLFWHDSMKWQRALASLCWQQTLLTSISAPALLGALHHVCLWLVHVVGESVRPVALAYNLLGQDCC